jgi:hypothetical protein
MAAARHTITTRRPAQTARPPVRQPPRRLADCTSTQTEARANVRKFSDSGQPPKADRWPEGPAGADANPAA